MNSDKSDILIWICVILAILLFIMAGRMYSYSEVLAYGPSPSKSDQAVLNNCITEIDNIKVPEISDSISDAVEAIRRNQLLVLQQQDNLLNDFRQEMNNNINKTNTWLSFAIGIMALVGVFIPVAIQFKIRSEEKDIAEKRRKELDRKLEDLDQQAEKNEAKLHRSILSQRDELSECRHSVEEALEKRITLLDRKIEEFESKKEDLDLYISQSDKKVKLSLFQQKQEIDLEIKSFRKEFQLQKILSRFMSFSCSYEDRALNDLPERSVLLKYIWNLVVETFTDILTDRCDKPEVDENDRVSIIMCLVMLNSMILKIKNSNEIKVYRRFDAINDEIQSLLSLLMPSINNHAVIYGISERLRKLNDQILLNPLP